MKAIPMGFVLFALCVVGGVERVYALPAGEKPVAVPKWEYRLLTKEQLIDLGKTDLAAGLNKLGDEGWELVVVETAYIFKRPRSQTRVPVEEIRRRIAFIEADVQMYKERLAWSERMAKKGFISDGQVRAEQDRLLRAEMALDQARKDLPASPADRKETPEKLRMPEE